MCNLNSPIIKEHVTENMVSLHEAPNCIACFRSTLIALDTRTFLKIKKLMKLLSPEHSFELLNSEGYPLPGSQSSFYELPTLGPSAQSTTRMYYLSSAPASYELFLQSDLDLGKSAARANFVHSDKLPNL